MPSALAATSGLAGSARAPPAPAGRGFREAGHAPPGLTDLDGVGRAALATATASTVAALARRRPAGGQPGRRARVAARATKTFAGPDGEEFRYDTADLLGEGAQGTVYQGVRVATGESVAVKSVPVWRFILDADGAEKVERIDREARKQKMLGEHPNICKLFASVDTFRPGTTQHPQYKMLVMQLIKGKELAQVVADAGALAEPVARHIFRQVLSAVAHMHGLQQVHRDLKAENILLAGGEATEQTEVKIIDFGVTRNLAPGETFKTVAGTLSIRPPEIAKSKLAYLPDKTELKVHVAKFKAPSEEFPGFGLISRTPTGYGARLNGVEADTPAAAQGLQDGWIITKIQGTDVEDMLFQANPDDSSHAKVPKIVNMLMEISTDFTMELVELPRAEFTQKVDLWALGVVLYTMLAGRVPFKTDMDIIQKDYDQEPLQGCSAEARAVLAGLLDKSPETRLSLEALRAEPWLAA